MPWAVYGTLQYQNFVDALYQDSTIIRSMECQSTVDGWKLSGSNTPTPANACASVISAMQARKISTAVCKSDIAVHRQESPGTCGAPHTAGIGIDIIAKLPRHAWSEQSMRISLSQKGSRTWNGKRLNSDPCILI